MSIWKKRPVEDVDTERARLMARADVKGHEETLRRIQRNADRQERAETRQRQRVEKQRVRRDRADNLRVRAEALRQRMILVLPLIGVNVLALGGQVGFAKDHLGWALPQAVLFGAVLESIALYIQWHAHQALMAGDSAIKLKSASYLVGVVVGGLNYDHFSGPDWSPTTKSVVFGGLSLVSPWLWAMHGRHANRKRLRELGLVDERAPHFSGGRWVHFPVQTWGALRWGIANNVQDPAAAWAGYQELRRIRAELKDRRSMVRVIIVRSAVSSTPSLIPSRIVGRLAAPTKPAIGRATAPRTVPSARLEAAGTVPPHRAIGAPTLSHPAVPTEPMTVPATEPASGGTVITDHASQVTTAPSHSGTVAEDQASQADAEPRSSGSVPPELRPGVTPPDFVINAARQVYERSLNAGKGISDRKLAVATRDHFNVPYAVIGRSACQKVIADVERAEETG